MLSFIHFTFIPRVRRQWRVCYSLHSSQVTIFTLFYSFHVLALNQNEDRAGEVHDTTHSVFLFIQF